MARDKLFISEYNAYLPSMALTSRQRQQHRHFEHVVYCYSRFVRRSNRVMEKLTSVQVHLQDEWHEVFIN